MSVESTVVELRQLLSNLVDHEALDEGLCCVYCFLDPETQGHAETCPWAVARAYLGLA